MRQIADNPVELHDLVASLTYRPGWTFTLSDIDRGQGSEGLTLDIVTKGYNAYHVDQGENYRVHHYMPVPPAAYNRQSWQRWLFDQILLVERHETCEFFRFELDDKPYTGEGEFKTQRRVDRPFQPNHSPGWDPYIVSVLTTDEARRTSFRGIMKGADAT